MTLDERTYYFKKVFLGDDEGKAVLKELKTMVSYDDIRPFDNGNHQYFCDGRRSIISEIITTISRKEKNE